MQKLLPISLMVLSLAGLAACDDNDININTMTPPEPPPPPVMMDTDFSALVVDQINMNTDETSAPLAINDLAFTFDGLFIDLTLLTDGE
ncbi:MAG: hypothetical protein K0U79_13920 [Gammaproteobacteria bacterium]|nr:hypothetical protein [Gammaproteobacteria bacterium]